MNLLDIVEDWASTKDWWTYRSTEADECSGKKYLNICVDGKPPFGPNGNYTTLYEDGFLSKWPGCDVYLSPADPEYFTKLETFLDKT